MKLQILFKTAAQKVRRIAIVSAITGPFLLLLFSGTLHASSPDPMASLKPDTYNGDYLNHVEVPKTETTFYNGMFSKLTSEMSQRYNSFYQIYDERRKYGLNEMGDEIRFSDANKDMMRWTLRRLLQENVTNPARRFAWGQVRNEFDQIRNGSTEAQNIRAAQAQKTALLKSRADAGRGATLAPAAESKDFFQTVTYFYNSGVPINDEARLHFHYDVPAGLMDMALTNPIIEPTVGYTLMPMDFNLANGFRTSTNNERLLISLRKSLGKIGFSSGVHYELVTRSLNYGISKHIIGPVDASIDQSHYASASWRNETTATINMSAGF